MCAMFDDPPSQLVALRRREAPASCDCRYPVECLIARYLLGIRDPVSKQWNAMMPAEPRYATSPATFELRHTLPWLVGPLRREDTCKSPGTILQVPNLKGKQLICIASRPNSFLPSNLLHGHVFDPPRSFAIRAAATTSRARTGFVSLGSSFNQQQNT